MEASDKSPSLGTVVWMDGRARATLTTGGWKVMLDGQDDADLAACLEARYLDHPTGPEEGWPGRSLLAQVAHNLGGTVVDLPPLPELDPGAIY